MLLLGNDLETLYFDNHFGAYVVRPIVDCESYVNAWFLHELLDASPLNIVEGYGVNKLFVPLRHWVCRH